MNKQDSILKTLNIVWYNESGKVLHFDANTAGVYLYRNTLELDKVYIGSTAILSKRTARHPLGRSVKSHPLGSIIQYVNMVGHNINLEFQNMCQRHLT